MQDALEDRRSGGSFERLPPCPHLIKNGPERKHVAAAVNILSKRLFRRHVGDGAQHCARAGQGVEIEGGGRGALRYHSLTVRQPTDTLSPKGARSRQ